jgi:GNAT superfamily N-acetyltransferase
MTMFRRATISDVPALLLLVKEYWNFEGISGFDAQVVANQLTRLLSSPGLGAGWIAEREGAPAGYLLAVYVFSLEHLGLTAEIDEFFVLPAQRGQGVGGELLRIAELEFARVGCTNVALQLARSNDSARAYYRRHAYRERFGYELLDKMLPQDR